MSAASGGPGNGAGMGDVQEVLRYALELGEEGRWEEMAQTLSDALDASDDEDGEPFLLCWLGVAESELGNDGAAYEAFRRCVELDPSDPHVLSLAGSGLAQFDDPDAETALRAAALSAPDLPMARLNYGAYLSRTGMYDEALEQLRAAKALSPDDPVVVAEIGAAHVLRGEPTEGVSALEEALALAPDDSWTRVLYGLVMVELDRREDAAEQLITAARERDEDAEAMLMGTLAGAAVGWLDAAEELLAKAEYAAEGADVATMQEVESAMRAGEEPAWRMLRQTLAPTSLRERLAQPL